MSLQVEKLEKNMAKLTIEVSASELEKALQSAYMKQKNKISLPGFRKGKVPRQMIEKMYGAEIFYDDAANALIPKAYADAYDECELDIVSRPEIDVVQIEKGKDFIFTATVATKPEVTLGEYKGLEVDKVSTRVTQKEVDAKIQEEAEKNARTITVEDRAVQDGDEVVLDFEGFVDGVAFEGGKGENYPLTIGSGSFIPGFEEQLVGAEAEKEVEVKVTFPEDYHAEDLKGKEAVFKCTVHEIKAKELPEIDDEFAAEVSEFDTLEEYKADVKAKIKEQKAAEGKAKQEDQVVEQAVKNATYELPEAMVETQAEQMANDFAQRMQSQGLTMEQYFQFTGTTAEQMMEDLKPQAVKRIETRLVLEAIAKAENIEISDEKLDEELAKMAESYKMEVDKLKEFMGENEKKQMEENEETSQIMNRFDDTKVSIFTADFEVLTKLTGFKLTRGMLCAMRRKPLRKFQDLCDGINRIAILENVQNPTNVGAIFRSAAALNMEAVLLSPGCSDPLYRRASRVSMGTVFQIPWTFIRDSNEMRCKREVIWPKQVIAELKKLGYKTAALALTDDSVSIDDSELMKEEKLAVILGNEGEGLENETIALCDYTVKIPMTHGVDSLNVAAASAVAFWQLGKIIL